MFIGYTTQPVHFQLNWCFEVVFPEHCCRLKQYSSHGLFHKRLANQTSQNLQHPEKKQNFVSTSLPQKQKDLPDGKNRQQQKRHVYIIFQLQNPNNRFAVVDLSFRGWYTPKITKLIYIYTSLIFPTNPNQLLKISPFILPIASPRFFPARSRVSNQPPLQPPNLQPNPWLICTKDTVVKHQS